MLNLEEGNVMNMKIYTGSVCRSIITYVQYENIFSLLIFDGSGMKLTIEENTSLEVLRMCSSCARRRIRTHRPPFIGN
jgi:hypothetical protein